MSQSIGARAGSILSHDAPPSLRTATFQIFIGVSSQKTSIFAIYSANKSGIALPVTSNA